MNPKTVVLVALGMTGSFCLIFALMLAFLGPTPGPAQKTRPQATAAPQPRSPSQPPPQSRVPAPAPEPSLTPITAAEKNPPAPTAQDEAARHELQAMRQTIKEQIDQLKKDRDRKVATLATRLAALPAAAAAEQCDQLDEEIAALVLKRLSSEKRRSLLSHLPDAKAKNLRRRL